MTSKNGSPLNASSAANTDNPLPWSYRSLRTHRTETPSRTDNSTQNRSIFSARYPTTTSTSSTPTSTRPRTARSNKATPATGTSGLTRPRRVRRRDPIPPASTSPRTTLLLPEKQRPPKPGKTKARTAAGEQNTENIPKANIAWTAFEPDLNPFEVTDRDLTTLTGEAGRYDELPRTAHEQLVRPSTR